MGNVLATSTPSSPPPDVSSPPLGDFSQLPKESKELSTNPGTVEELHKQCLEVFPVVFEGGKFMINKGLGNNLQISHALNLPTVQPPNYRFSSTYVGNPISQSEAYPILIGDIDPSGNLNANIIHQIYPGVRSKFVAQIENNVWQATQFTTDFKGSHSTASLTFGNLDLFSKSGLIVAHYLQQVSPKLALGSELAYQRGPNVPGGQIAVHSLLGKYTGSDFTLSGTLGMTSLKLCYYQKCSDSLQIGAELETSSRLQEAVASTAFQVDIPKAETVFRGKIDSNLTVSAVLEKKLVPLPFTFALSAMHSHSKNKFRLGVGFYIG